METAVSGGTAEGCEGRTVASHATAQHWPSPQSSEAPEAEPLDLVTVPARQGLEAVDILRRGSAVSGAVGPVLHDGPCDTVGFLVPPGTADGWDMPGSACTQTLGRGVSLDIPEPGGPGAAQDAVPEPTPEPPVTGTGWLLPPTDTVPVTDPTALRRALGEAARLIEAADRCR
ncbi:hypothetical protein ACIO3O_19065 [Streptomyces sp. NPDC087440]|uniref:hypothetical protein n=1 Tax=Streptomyces sp. NPDC087440 TaxID=3365790 RepID=UPI0037F13BA1